MARETPEQAWPLEPAQANELERRGYVLVLRRKVDDRLRALITEVEEDCESVEDTEQAVCRAVRDIGEGLGPEQHIERLDERIDTAGVQEGMVTMQTTDTFTDGKGRRYIAGVEVSEVVWKRHQQVAQHEAYLFDQLQKARRRRWWKRGR